MYKEFQTHVPHISHCLTQLHSFKRFILISPPLFILMVILYCQAYLFA